MNKNNSSLNLNLKSALVNLDLDMELELNRYENERQGILLEETINFDSENLETQTNNPLIEQELETDSSTKEKEVIPVAYRVLSDEPESLLDIILTPWTISSLILFLLANAVIFINFSSQTETAIDTDNDIDSELSSQLVVNEEKTRAKVENKIDETKAVPKPTPITKQNNQVIAQTKTLVNQNPPKTKPSTPPIIPSTAPIPPSIAPLPPLNTSNYNPIPTVSVNQQISPYPDLTTALLSNSNRPTSPQPVSIPQPTIPLPPPPPSQKKIETKTETKTEVNLDNKINSNSTKKAIPNFEQPNDLESMDEKLQYSVITEYQNIKYYQKIQSLYPKAFITNIGTEMKIQLDVFNNEEDANKLIQNLQKQEITSYIYTSVAEDK